MTYEITPTRWPVVAWPRLKQLIGPVEAHVAGGYAAWHMSDRFNWKWVGQPYDQFQAEYHSTLRTMMPSNHPNDIDIFTYTDPGYYSMVARLTQAGFNPVKESKYCTTWIDTGYLNEDNWSHLRYCLDQSMPSSWRLSAKVKLEETAIPVQLIKPVFGKNLVEVLDHFDFYSVKFALLDGHNMLAHKDAVKCLDEKALKHAHPEALLTNPFYVLGRSLKYAKKGFKVNYMELFKMVVTAQAADVNNVDLRQVGELVQHFGRYLHSGESLGRGEDFRPTFEDAYGEWLRYLLAKKAKIQ